MPVQVPSTSVGGLEVGNVQRALPEEFSRFSVGNLTYYLQERIACLKGFTVSHSRGEVRQAGRLTKTNRGFACWPSNWLPIEGRKGSGKEEEEKG